MRLALHPATCGWDVELMADYCRYTGVTDLFYHLRDVEGYRHGALDDPDALQTLAGNYSSAGLRLSAVNEFLANDAEALDRQRQELPATVDQLAKAGVETLILFALQPESEELWDALSALYRSIVPRAASAGVRIATHGHWCAGHIAYNRETVQRIIDLAPDSANGICLCAGCFHQAGEDPAEVVRAMPDRIHCVHIRDTSLQGGCDLEELPLGAGSVPITDTVRALAEVGYKGLVIPEHLSALKAQTNMETTHAHAVGYIRGILDAIESGGKNA